MIIYLTSDKELRKLLVGKTITHVGDIAKFGLELTLNDKEVFVVDVHEDKYGQLSLEFGVETN